MSVTPATPAALRTTRPSMTPASTTGMSRLRKRLGPGTMLVRANNGTSSGESSDTESRLTITGSKGTRSQMRYAPLESVRVDNEPTSTRAFTIAGSPTSRMPLAFRSMKTRPDKPERSSEGPGATPSRLVRRSQSTDPWRNCVALTGWPGGASTDVTARIADKYEVTVTVYAGSVSMWGPIASASWGASLQPWSCTLGSSSYARAPSA